MTPNNGKYELVRLCGPQQYMKYTKYTKYTKTKKRERERERDRDIYIYIYIYSSHKYIVFEAFEHLIFRSFENLKTCFVLSLVQIRGWDGLYHIEETK